MFVVFSKISTAVATGICTTLKASTREDEH